MAEPPPRRAGPTAGRRVGVVARGGLGDGARRPISITSPTTREAAGRGALRLPANAGTLAGWAKTSTSAPR
jgi:hypothetical protein